MKEKVQRLLNRLFLNRQTYQRVTIDKITVIRKMEAALDTYLFQHMLQWLFIYMKRYLPVQQLLRP
jgi:hypothetical protein